MKREPDLFDLFSAPPAPVVLPASDDLPLVHWMHVTPLRARTGCGIYASSYDLAARLATTEAGETLSCSLDVYSDRVTCQACKDAI